jgi:magnesium-transporting ATPase (P-type)
MPRPSDAPSLPRQPWHALAVDAVADALGIPAGESGLDAAEVARRVARFGPNALPTVPVPGAWRVIVHQVRSPLVSVLLLAAGVSLALGDPLDAGFILLVVVVNTALGAWQEWRAERQAAALHELIGLQARVCRDGVERLVDAAALVPGDLVRLESGQRVPADLRLLEVAALRTDESLLTGESVAVVKGTDAVDAAAPVSDRPCMAHAGSLVVSGRARGVVVATGGETQVGRIAGAVVGTEAAKPPLVLRLERFGRQLSVVVLLACAVLAAIGLARGLPPLEVFFTAVALAVSAIPEGLPVAVTVALSIATRRMAARRVIVRRLAAVEGLGSCTCIASDKTGTLTVNRQAVRRVVLADGTVFDVDGAGDAPRGTIRARAIRAAPGAAPGEAAGEAPGEAPADALRPLAQAVVLCNEGVFVERDGAWHQGGDAVDVALLAFATKLGLDVTAVRAGAAVTRTIPFESSRAFAATFHRAADGERVAVKGAPEAVLAACRAQSLNGRDGPLDRTVAERTADALTADGYRVLAVAVGTAPEPAAPEPAAPTPPPAGPSDARLPPLTLLGFVALIDPPRPEARDAIARCRAAGITVVMITGDHPRTALAIARELGIAEAEAAVVSGATLARASASGEAEALVAGGRVFARVTPQQKLQIVTTLQRLGHLVAVTGDGVNDAPALKAANIGVAMGSGADVAKDTASLIVTDDRFASIEAGVEEGRVAYANIRKVTLQVVSTGAAEVLLLLLALAVGLPLPLTAVQLLWLNLVTNGIQDVALAFEAGEPDMMSQAPRRPGEGLFDRRLVEQAVLGGAVIGGVAFAAWWQLLAAGVAAGAARNAVLLLFVLMQNVHVFNCRSERRSAFRVPLARNRLLVAGVLAAQGLHLLALHLPLTQRILEVHPVTWLEWLLALGSALLLLATMEAYKQVRSRTARGPAPRAAAS